MRTRELALREGFVHVPDEVKDWTLMPVEVGAVDAHALPVLVRTLPAVLGATAVTALVPLPMRTAFAVNVVAPVPPLATDMVVPFHVPDTFPVIVAAPVTVKSLPTVTLPLASLTRLLTVAEGWRIVTTLAVDISGLPYVYKTAAGLQRHKLVGVVSGPVDDIAADQHLFPIDSVRPEAALGDDGDMHVGLGVRVHGKNVTDLREVVD
jgi:hypothetical protein